MDEKLAFAIREAQEIGDDLIDLQDALTKLSEHPQATITLISACLSTARTLEKKWQEIEQLPDFQANYTSRDIAVIDCLRQQRK